MRQRFVFFMGLLLECIMKKSGKHNVPRLHAEYQDQNVVAQEDYSVVVTFETGEKNLT